MRFFREIFDDWMTRVGAMVFALIAVLVVFNMRSDLLEKYPFFGLLSFLMVPVLFIAGGVIFIMEILKLTK